MYQCIVLHHLRVPGVPGLLGEVVRVEGVRIGVVGETVTYGFLVCLASLEKLSGLKVSGLG